MPNRPVRTRCRFVPVEALETRRLFSGGTAAVVGYLPDYEVTDALMATLNASGFGGLTQVDYFSVLPDANGLLPGTSAGDKTNAGTTTSGGASLLGDASQLQRLVTGAHAAGVKVNVAVGGGGSYGTTLDGVVAGGSSMWQAFASSVSQFVATHGIDGMDIDWEPGVLRPNDVADYGGLLAAVRAANPDIILTAAVNSMKLPVEGGGQAYVLDATAVNALTKVNVMAYDLLPGNVSPTAMAQSALAGWGNYVQSLGVSRQKLTFGLPFYGTNGSTWDVVDARKYNQLVNASGVLQSPTADSATLGGKLWKYNGPATIAAKTAYALDNGYGGTMVWEIGQDYFVNGTTYSNTHSLLPQIKNTTVARTGTVGGSVRTPAGVAVVGSTVYVDVNNNGQCDAADPSAVTDTAGAYTLPRLLADAYAVRHVVPAGYTQTTPAGGAAVPVTLTAGQTAVANFVITPQPLGTSLNLTRGGVATSNATQALAFTATLAGGVADGESVVLKDASRGGVVVATASLVGGKANFAVPAGALLAGSHGLFAAYGGNASLAASVSTTLTQAVELVVTGVTVNGNTPTLTGVQRSRVNDVVYAFSEPVNVGSGAFSISVRAGRTGIVPTLAWTALDPAADGSATRWAITFGGSGVTHGSIADGVYDLAVNATAVTADAAPSVAVRPRPVDAFHRLTGDTDGDRAVDFDDFVLLQSAFGQAPTPANGAGGSDLDGSGRVDFDDFVAMQTHFGESFIDE